jgi:hypothetical protein
MLSPFTLWRAFHNAFYIAASFPPFPLFNAVFFLAINRVGLLFENIYSGY